MIKVLVICDDFWHVGEVVARGLKPLDGDGMELDVVMDAKDILTSDMLNDYRVIICAKSNTLVSSNSAPWFEKNVTAVMPEQLISYVENGGGFIALHAGNCYKYDGSRENLGFITGNSFMGHPPQCEVEIKIKDGSHPITCGIPDFTVRDEHYRINIGVDDCHLLFESVSKSDAGTQAAGYTRELGRGRVCVMTPGHNCAVISHRYFIRMLHNAVKWCAGEL